MSVILELKGLGAEAVSRPGEPLLEGVSFSLEAGEILGLVGQSGSGKSLTALAIAGLLPRAIRPRGSVLLGGREIIGAPERELNRVRGRDVSVVFQEPSASLDPLMKIGRQIALPLRKHTGLKGAELREAVFSLMEEVKLQDIPRIARSLPHEISGGQRQRAAIAIALACSPRLLIADEPTSSLDASIQKQLAALIYDTARRRGMAVLFISHDIAVVCSAARRIMVMKRGRIVETAGRDELIRRPHHEYTKLLIQSAKQLSLAARGGE
jgi:peptide/nickel transport system ATP-binding protein